MNDNTMPWTLGQISGIMAGIFSRTEAALRIGPKTSVDSEQEAAFYRDQLQGILESARRAEAAYAAWSEEGKRAV